MKNTMRGTLVAFAMILSASAHAAYTCTNTEVNTIYIPILREVADWPDSQLRPYAKELCQLTKEKKALQKMITARAEYLRSIYWRICKEVIPGNPNPTAAQCRTAHNAKINSLIDQCIALDTLGHNPHNVLLFLDPARVEVACLRGTNTSLNFKIENPALDNVND